MKNSEADDDRLDKKENGVELMIPFVSCDRGRSGDGRDHTKRTVSSVLRHFLFCPNDRHQLRYFSYADLSGSRDERMLLPPSALNAGRLRLNVSGSENRSAARWRTRSGAGPGHLANGRAQKRARG